jgi:N-acetylglutamate synthase-like GNAT family acetyltransferase
MLITRATRHDKDDIRDFLAAHDRADAEVDEGTYFIAREGRVTGSVKLVDIGPQTVVVADMVVTEQRRGQGIGSALMAATMSGRGGSLYLCCHDDVVGFYERFGFARLPFDSLPAGVQDYHRRAGEYPFDPADPHYFMKAR